jgi:DNA (cytosine-5)-methyltransferase 1
MSLGLEQAGFQPVAVNELNAEALATYLLNRREWPDLLRFVTNDIFELTGAGRERDLASLRSALLSHYRLRDIDLVVGGPPCQGYSGLGIRRSFRVDRLDVPSNHLYREMAKVIRALRPRAFVFENVRGLMSSRWTAGGQPGEVWSDVVNAFTRLGEYEVRPAVVEAHWYGVPQHRPRVLLIGIRQDVSKHLSADFANAGFAPPPDRSPPDPNDFLGDLVDHSYRPGGRTPVYPADAGSDTQAEYRRDPQGLRVRTRGEPITDHDYSRHHERIVKKFAYMLAHGGTVREADRTRKFSQRVLPATWPPQGPTITATSLPDDYVHFSQPRTLSVREWARLQTFPDWYEFTGKRTTGGRRRAGDPSRGDWSREVPKYTQIGNAVPVWMARAIGRHLLAVVR